MGKIPHNGQWFWERFDPARGGGDLAALRRGIGQAAGTVPGMWRFYRAYVNDELAREGRVSTGLIAEHAALTLYGVHQQSQRQRMHSDTTPLGVALRQLRNRPDISADALDRRVNAAATAGSVTEVIGHLRGLITQLRGKQIPLDYNRLVEDLHDWTWPDSRARARRRWGTHYYTYPETRAEDSDQNVEVGTALPTDTVKEETR